LGAGAAWSTATEVDVVAGAGNSGFAGVSALAITSVSVFLAFGATNWAVIVVLLDPSFLALGARN
jgi:hypothetical protein